MEAVVTTVGGMIGGWIISHFYYRRSNKDSEKSDDELKDDIIEEFRAEALDRIKNSFDDTGKIQEVLRELWNEIKKKKGKDFEKLRCPRCASDKIAAFWVTIDENREFDVAECTNCGYKLS